MPSERTKVYLDELEDRFENRENELREIYKHLIVQKFDESFFHDLCTMYDPRYDKQSIEDGNPMGLSKNEKKQILNEAKKWITAIYLLKERN